MAKKGTTASRGRKKDTRPGGAFSTSAARGGQELVSATPGLIFAQRHPSVVWGSVLLLVFAAYWPALRGEFTTYDDPTYVSANEHVTAGLTLTGIGWGFRAFDGGNWHPVTWLTHMFDCDLYGLRPWGHHLTNLVFHALNSTLLWILLRRLTGAQWRSLFVAAAFALHPVHVESVAWVSERKDVLSAFFFLATLLAYVRYAKQNVEIRKRRAGAHLGYVVALILFALGLMSKPMLVTAPFVLLLLDHWPLQRLQPSSLTPHSATVRSVFLEKTPFFMLAAVISAITLVAQKQLGAVQNLEVFPLAERLSNAVVAYARYLGKLAYPVGLAAYYPHPRHWPVWAVVGSGLLLLTVTALGIAWRKQRPWFLVGWLWFVGMLVPVIGLVQAGQQSIADRYTYLPSIGVFIILAWVAAEYTRSWRFQGVAASAASVLVLGLWAAVSFHQAGFWKDSAAVFGRAVAVTRGNYMAEVNWGLALKAQGRSAEAVKFYREAVRLHPKEADLYHALGKALDDQGQLKEALEAYQQALRLRPDFAETCYELGTVLWRKGREQEALQQFQRAVQLDPKLSAARMTLASALFAQGRYDEGIRHFEEVLKLEPNSPTAHANLGVALAARGRRAEAIAHLSQALKLKPNYPEVEQQLRALTSPTPPQP